MSYRLPPHCFSTRRTHSPSSTTVPAYTVEPGRRATGMDSPVRDAWLTMTSPSSITLSSGIMPPICTAMRSPGRTLLRGSCTSPSSVLTQTRSMFRDMLRARSSTDFLWVHSSSSSPSPSRNITEPAVPKSPRAMEMPTDRPSSSSTCSCRRHRQRTARPR